MKAFLMRRQSSPLAIVDPHADLVNAFLEARSPNTLRAYSEDLEDFRAFTGEPTIGDAARLLLGQDSGHANRIALGYRNHMVQRGNAPASVNRRMAAVRSLAKLGRMLGVCGFPIDVPNLPVQPYRDTRGPGEAGYAKLLAACGQDAKGKRDRAILRLLHDLALRRSEVTGLRLEDYFTDAAILKVVGKGRHAAIPLTVPEKTREALNAWIAVRGKEPGALFWAMDNRDYGKPLRPNGINELIKTLGEKTGVRVKPHGLRHAGITKALDRTGGNIRAVAKFSRHRDIRTITIYDDSREDMAGQVAEMVAGD